MKSLLIMLLFRLIDGEVQEQGKDAEKIQDWLIMSWSHPGFRAFMNRRGNLIIRELAGGSAMLEVARPDYIRRIGQRFELLRIASMAKATFDLRQKERTGKGRKPIKIKRT